jgi:enoyl-CoA hydratase/carnithine racemase
VPSAGRRRWRLILTGEPFSAERAHELGLVNRASSSPAQATEEALALADQITAQRSARRLGEPQGGARSSHRERRDTLKQMTDRSDGTS